jgi:hypothetical protein
MRTLALLTSVLLLSGLIPARLAAQTPPTSPLGKSFTVTEDGGGAHLEDTLEFLTATTGREVDPTGDIDGFTYTYTVTGANTAEVRAQEKPDKWSDYTFTFDGSGGGSYVQRRFDKNAFKDQRSGDINEDSGAAGAPSDLIGVTIELVEAAEVEGSERLDFLTGTRGREVEPGDVDPFAYTYQVTGASTADAVLTFKINRKWDEYTFTFTSASGGTFTVDRFDKGVLKDTKSGTFTVAENTEILDPLASGYYDGVLDLSDLSGTDDDFEGRFRLQVGRGGRFSGRFKLEDDTFPLRGTFDDSGHHQTQIALSDGTSLDILLEMEAINTGFKITGSVDDGTQSFVVDSDQRVFHPITNPAPQAGRYTLVLTGDGSPAQTLDVGDGAAIVGVSRGGIARILGRQGDGYPWATAVALRQNGDFTFLNDLYRGGGSIGGRLQFQDVPNVSDLDGILNWTRPAAFGAGSINPLYQAGFTVKRTAVGSRYTAPARGDLLIAIGPGPDNLALDITEGGLAVAKGFVATLNTRNRVEIDRSAGLRLRLQTRTGFFNGRFVDDSGVAPRMRGFLGVVLQKQGNGSGFFVGDGVTGHVDIGPVAP